MPRSHARRPVSSGRAPSPATTHEVVGAQAARGASMQWVGSGQADGLAQRAGPDVTCAEEPVHTPGAIQPHGLLFALDQRSLRIEQVSENVLNSFGHAAPELLGRDFRSLLSPASGAALAEALRAGNHERLSLTLEDLRGVPHEVSCIRPLRPKLSDRRVVRRCADGVDSHPRRAPA